MKAKVKAANVAPLAYLDHNGGDDFKDAFENPEHTPRLYPDYREY